VTALRRKILRDLTHEGTRSVLVVFAIALGICGFMAVLSAYAILTRELNRGYLATNPASATLRMDAIDTGLMRAVAANPAISDAEARRSLSGRLQAKPGEWRTLRLFVVEDFARIRISKLEPQIGAWPPAPGELLIERDALQVARAGIGDSVTVKTTRGTEAVLRVGGTVHDVGQAQARMENMVYAYVTPDTLRLLGETPYLDELKILVAGDRSDEKHVRLVAAAVRRQAEGLGHQVRGVEIPVPGEHPHARIMGVLLLSMSSFGLCIVVLSGFLVANLMIASMALQVRQIGVMKAIGASTGQVARIYLGQALLLGAAAVVIAVPTGIWQGRVLCRVMAELLNFDIASFATPIWIYLVAAATGLAVPILAAAYPVWNSCRVSVRTALDDSGGSDRPFGTGGFDRILMGMGGPLRPLLLAMRNSFRRRTRLVLTLVTLVAGGLFFLTGLNIRASLVHTLDRMFAARKYDLSVNLATMYPMEQVRSALRDLPAISRYEGWIVTEGATPANVITASGASAEEFHSAPGGEGVHQTEVLGKERFAVIAPPANTAMLRLDIVKGRNLRPGDTDVIVLNTALAAAAPMMIVGKTVAIRVGPAPVKLRVIGIAREAFSGPVGYVPLELFEKTGGHKDTANNLRLTLHRKDSGSIGRVKAALEKSLEREHLRAQTITGTAESRFGFDQHMLMIYVFLIIVSSIIAVIGGLGLMTTMSLNVLERRREMGVLRAIGASPSFLLFIVVAEGVTVAILSWATAALAAWPVSQLLGNTLARGVFPDGLDFQFELAGLLVWFVVSILVGALASLAPAWSAAKTTIRESLTHG
jgi:putative ABC transport system permease protein